MRVYLAQHHGIYCNILQLAYSSEVAKSLRESSALNRSYRHMIHLSAHPQPYLPFISHSVTDLDLGCGVSIIDRISKCVFRSQPRQTLEHHNIYVGYICFDRSRLGRKSMQVMVQRSSRPYLRRFESARGGRPHSVWSVYARANLELLTTPLDFRLSSRWKHSDPPACPGDTCDYLLFTK